MNRRDLLKMLGIGGVGAVANAVGGGEVEAAPIVQPVEPSIQDHIDYLNALYVGDMPSAIVSSAVIQGTVSVLDGQSWKFQHGTGVRPTITIGGPNLVDAQIAGYRRVDNSGGDE